MKYLKFDFFRKHFEKVFVENMGKNTTKQNLLEIAQKYKFFNINMGIFLVFCQKDFSPLNEEELINHKIFKKRQNKIKKVNGSEI